MTLIASTFHAAVEVRGLWLCLSLPYGMQKIGLCEFARVQEVQYGPK